MRSLTDMAGDHSVPTAQVLTALRIVATRTGAEELAEWTTKELEGYEQNDEVPEHRIWDLPIVGSVFNPYQGLLSNVDVSPYSIPEEYRESATRFRCRMGIHEIEELLKNGKSTFQVRNPNLVPLINMGNDEPGWQCIKASAQCGRGQLFSVVNKARQTALKMCLECEKSGVELKWDDGKDSNREEQTKWRGILKQETVRTTIREVAVATIKSLAGL